MPLPLQPDEQLLYEGFANLFRGIEGVGGVLRVTNQRLVFQAHVVNVRYGAVEIPLGEIAEVRPRNSMFVIPNGMLVRTDAGAEHKFVVWGRSKWIDLLEKLRVEARLAK